MRYPVVIFLVLSSLMTMTGVASDKTQIDPDWKSLTFKIEDSRCFVGIAPIYLSVSELKPEDGNLVGTYRIKVPLKKSRNDHGKIVLPLNGSSVDVLGVEGGVLKGHAHSMTEKGDVNEIVCVVIPEDDQAIELAITTDERTVKFSSRYSVIEADQSKGDS